jgi:subtilase family serine protease
MYDSTHIDTQTVTALAPRDSATLSFSWDTTGVTEGDYTIKAVADPLSGETEIQDNTHSEVVITVTGPPPAMPTELVLGVILATATICIIVAFLYVRRRGSTKT